MPSCAMIWERTFGPEHIQHPRHVVLIDEFGLYLYVSSHECHIGLCVSFSTARLGDHFAYHTRWAENIQQDVEKMLKI